MKRKGKFPEIPVDSCDPSSKLDSIVSVRPPKISEKEVKERVMTHEAKKSANLGGKSRSEPAAPQLRGAASEGHMSTAVGIPTTCSQLSISAVHCMYPGTSIRIPSRTRNTTEVRQRKMNCSDLDYPGTSTTRGINIIFHSDAAV